MSISFHAAHGRGVVASDSGENVGKIKSLVIDIRASGIESIHISGKNKNAEVVPWSDIKSFGTDAIMITSANSITKPEDHADIDAVKTDIVGSRVLTTTGLEIGKVEDVEFDEKTGKLVSVTTKAETITSEHFRSLGSYALVVSPY